MAPFDPYYEWLGIPPEEQPADHYRLLSLRRFEGNVEAIANAADQRMGFVRAFQLGPRADTATQILNELAAAKLCLLNSERKRLYDSQLRQSIATTRSAQSHATQASATKTSNSAIRAVIPRARRLQDAPTERQDAEQALPGRNHTADGSDTLSNSDTFSDGLDLTTYLTGTIAPEVAVSRRSARRQIQRPRTAKTWITVVAFLLSPVIGLSLGYVVLCCLGDDYDFLGLWKPKLEQKDNQEEKSAETPQVATIAQAQKPAEYSTDRESTVVRSENAGQKTPSPMPETSEHITRPEFGDVMNRFRHALAHRDFGDANKLLMQLRSLETSPMERRLADQWSNAYSSARPFWSALSRILADSQTTGLELKLKGQTVTVADSSAEFVFLRHGDQNVLFSLRDLPLSVAMAIYLETYSLNNDQNRFLVGVVHALDRWGNREESVRLLTRSVHAGLLSPSDFLWYKSLPPMEIEPPWLRVESTIARLPSRADDRKVGIKPNENTRSKVNLPPFADLPPAGSVTPVKITSVSDDVDGLSLAIRAPFATKLLGDDAASRSFFALRAEPGSEKTRSWSVVLVPTKEAKTNQPPELANREVVAQFLIRDRGLFFQWHEAARNLGAGTLRNSMVAVRSDSDKQILQLRAPVIIEPIALATEKRLQTAPIDAPDLPDNSALFWKVTSSNVADDYQVEPAEATTANKRIFIRAADLPDAGFELRLQRRNDGMNLIIRPVIDLPSYPNTSWTRDGLQELRDLLKAKKRASEKEIEQLYQTIPRLEAMLSQARSRTLPMENATLRGIAAREQAADIRNLLTKLRSANRRLLSRREGLPQIEELLEQVSNLESRRANLSPLSIHVQIHGESGKHRVEIVRTGTDS